MKKIFSLFFSLLLIYNYSIGQTDKTVYHPTSVQKPVYFDISPIMRDIDQSTIKTETSWKDGVVKNMFNVRPQDQEKNSTTVVTDPVRQLLRGVITSDTTIQNFDGTAGDGNSCPPDTYGDVGSNHYFSVVNCRYSVYTKDGSKIFGPSSNSSVWSGMANNHNDGDAIVAYDENADRWVFMQFSLPNYPSGPFFLMIAISQTPDPTGSWYRYEYQFSEMPDYPKISVWGDGYYMGFNRFGGTSMTFKGTGYAAFNRAKMLTGDPSAEMVYITLPSTNDAFAAYPSDCDGAFPPAGTPAYYVFDNASHSRLTLSEFHVDWDTTSNSTLTMMAQIPVQSFNTGLSNGIPQKGTSVKVQANSDRMMPKLQFRKFNDHWSMVISRTVNVGSGISGIRWYELRRDSVNYWDVYQQGTYAPNDGNYRWMGSLSMDQNGNMALGFSISSSSMYPSVRYTGRLAGDPLGQMTIGEKGIINGGGSQTNTWSGTPSRWGDYSSMQVDPSTPGKFWYTQEYYSTSSQANWKSRVGSFDFGSVFSAGVTASPEVLCLGQSTTLNATATGGSGAYTYSWSSIPAGFTSSQQDTTITPLVSTTYICTVSDGTNSKTDSVLVTVNGMTTVTAGNDTTYPNSLSAFQVFGQASNYQSLLWTTSGDGHFSMDTVATTVYFTGTNDKSYGAVDLTLFASALPPCTTSASDTVHITLSWPAGIGEEINGPFGIFMSPNPSNGVFSLTVRNLTDPQAVITVSDIQGKILYTDNVKGPAKSITRTISMPGISKGIYIIKVKSDNNVKEGKMVVK
ncbi:MAG: T9SS type A sorting domain-containing protein [Bacteroidota bacterium]|nr:T9SS type A sorting domain-containing protein [Bacteroidota bacterium]